MVRRGGFTLIELIFAIVIIAISVLSLPTISQVTAKNTERGLVQEAIFAAATELNEITTAHWDDNSIEGASSSLAKVIDGHSRVTKCEDNSSLPNYRLMPGHVLQPLHRRCLDSNSTEPADADVDSTIDALEDHEHSKQNIFDDTTVEAAGYKANYDSQIVIDRAANFNGSQSDMKSITITITDSDDNTIVMLKTYSANIGEIDFYKKEY